jgi:hypothetical protein
MIARVIAGKPGLLQKADYSGMFIVFATFEI